MLQRGDEQISILLYGYLYQSVDKEKRRKSLRPQITQIDTDGIYFFLAAIRHPQGKMSACGYHQRIRLVAPSEAEAFSLT